MQPSHQRANSSNDRTSDRSTSHGERSKPQSRHRSSRHRSSRHRAVRLALVVVGLIAGVLSAPAPASAAESFTFADVVAQPGLTDAHARVFRLYEAFFDREPEPGGAQFWVDRYDQCWTLQRITTHFGVSEEFVATYGADVTDAEFIDIIYANVLDRAPDPGGRAFWADQIATGAKTRAEVMLDFSWSEEFSNSLPYPFDGATDRPCDEGAADRPTPGSRGGIMAGDLGSMPLPGGACPARMTASWAERPDSPLLADLTGDGLVDAIALLTCTEGPESLTATVAVWRGSPAGALTEPDPEVVLAGIDEGLETSFSWMSIVADADDALLSLELPVALEGDLLCCPTGTAVGLYGFDGGVFRAMAGAEVTPWLIGYSVAEAAVAHDRTPVADYISQTRFDAASGFSGQWAVERPDPLQSACTRIDGGTFQCWYSIVPTDGGNLGLPGVINLELGFRSSDRRWIVTDASAGGS